MGSLDTTPTGALHALLVTLFSADEFRRWLRLGPDADLVPEIPGELAPAATVIDEALGVLTRNGRLQPAFFARLIAERPRQGEAIAVVARMWEDAPLAADGGTAGPARLREPTRHAVAGTSRIAPEPAPPSAASGPAPAAKIAIEALIMKGGGVKGLALAGAIMELEKYYTFSTFVGTSAGAIAAALLASGYTGQELERELFGLKFRSFLDDSWGRGVWNLLTRGGLNSGQAIVRWISDKLQRRLPHENRLPLEEIGRRLQRRLVMYAAGRPRGVIEFDSEGANKTLDTAFAVRCSMSIPWFFVPQKHEHWRVYDGGLLNNYPVDIYLQQTPGATTSFIALYLGVERASLEDSSQLSDVVDILLNRNERAAVEKFREQTIIIDTDPVGTVDFDLGEKEKEFLVLQGRAAALAFLVARGRLGGQGAEQAVRAAREAEVAKAGVWADRRRKRRRRWLAFALLVLVAGIVCLGPLLYARIVGPPRPPDGGAAHVDPVAAELPGPEGEPATALLPDESQVRGFFGATCVRSNSGTFAYCSGSTLDECTKRLESGPPGPFRANHTCVVRPTEVWCARHRRGDQSFRDMCTATKAQCESSRRGRGGVETGGTCVKIML